MKNIVRARVPLALNSRVLFSKSMGSLWEIGRWIDIIAFLFNLRFPRMRVRRISERGGGGKKIQVKISVKTYAYLCIIFKESLCNFLRRMENSGSNISIL